MKKIISIILAAVLVLLLVACGGSKSDNGKSTAAPSADAATTAEVTPEATPDPQELIKESLVSEDWRELFSVNYYTFSEDGTVSVSAGSSGNSGKYEIKNNFVTTTFLGSSQYVFVEEDGNKKLVYEDIGVITTIAPLSDYDAVLAATKEKMAEVAQELDSFGLFDDMKSNLVSAREKYIGNIYKFTGKVHDISSSNYCTLFIPNPKTNVIETDISLDLSKEDLLQLKEGETYSFIFSLEDLSENSSRNIKVRGFLVYE